MSACKTGKVAFESFSMAKNVHRRHMRDHVGPSDVYRCELCNKWHIGTRLHRTMHGRPKVEERETEV